MSAACFVRARSIHKIRLGFLRKNKMTNIKKMLLMVATAVLFSTVAFAQTQTQDVKDTDDFFSDPHFQVLNGCDRPTLEAINTAVRANLQLQELPPASVEADTDRGLQIGTCYQTVTQKRTQVFNELLDGITKTSKEVDSDDAFRYARDPKLAASLALQVSDDGTKNSGLLFAYNHLVLLGNFALEAMTSYYNHASDTRYRNLAARYNALANSAANVRLAQGSTFLVQPRALHCESSTNPITRVTQTDCE
jgi:hypothetical protein